MKEIEVKAKVHNQEALLEKLASLGCELSEPITQHDRIFVPKGMAIPVASGVNVLRIREQNDKYIFTLKQTQANELDCIEEELIISDPEKMVAICQLLGFEEISSVKKTRRTCHYQNYEICLDEVDSLGTFIEVETFADGDGETVQEQLFSFLTSLGVKPEDRVYHGYDVLMEMQQKPL